MNQPATTDWELTTQAQQRLLRCLRPSMGGDTDPSARFLKGIYLAQGSQFTEAEDAFHEDAFNLGIHPQHQADALVTLLVLRSRAGDSHSSAACEAHGRLNLLVFAYRDIDLLRGLRVLLSMQRLAGYAREVEQALKPLTDRQAA